MSQVTDVKVKVPPPRSQAGTGSTTAERAAAGKAARERAPLRAHAQFEPASDRDPVALLVGQAATRVPELVPIRHARMLVSPFAFYRGAALPMAADLARTATSGLRVQLCGDAHLANFGVFASPERRLVFDLNDFDETLPGPFEWDVKRLAASLVVAARENSFTDKEARRIALAAASGYRQSIREFAAMPLMRVWYSHIDIEDVLLRFKSEIKKKRYKLTESLLAKAETRDSTQALNKLTTEVDGERRIISDPPLIVPVEELLPGMERKAIYDELRGLVSGYARSLPADRRHLLRQFHVVHVARKVVGVGSVGTRVWIMLMEGDDGQEPLFLQAKEAEASVLAAFAGRSRYASQGERVVTGQRLMQAVSDIFLGWQRTTGLDGLVHHYYVRQLRDWKFSAPIEKMIPSGMVLYARLCAWTLARAHARSGDRIAIAAYLGGSEKFDRAIVEFAETYADINELDYAALADAVASGRVEAAQVFE